MINTSIKYISFHSNHGGKAWNILKAPLTSLFPILFSLFYLVLRGCVLLLALVLLRKISNTISQDILSAAILVIYFYGFVGYMSQCLKSTKCCFCRSSL